MWEAVSAGTAQGLDALDAALNVRGSSLGAAFHDYAVAARAMRGCADDQLPFCFADAGAYVAAAGGRPDHASVAAVGGQAEGLIEDDYAIRWVGLPDARQDVSVANTAAGGNLRTTAVCTAGSRPVRVAFPELGAGQSAAIQSFPPPGCTGAAVALSTSSRTAPDATASVLRSYRVASGPPTVPLAVTLAGSGTGIVASTPGSILCGTACAAAFGLGSVVTLTATPSKTSTFRGWSGACSGIATTCAVTLNNAAGVTATFDAVPPIPKPPAVELSESERKLAADTKGPRLGIGRVRLTRRALSLRITCPATEPHRCSGFVALTARAASKRLNLGQQAFLRLKGGRHKVLRFPLTARSRAAIRRVTTLRVVASSRTRDDAFNYVAQKRALRVRTPR
jgi:hypothetical protein